MKANLPTKTPSQTDLIYIAGFFDGEGCIHIGRIRERGYFLQVSAANTERSIIDEMHAYFGGRVHRLQKKGDRQPCWRLDLASVKASQFLSQILPYLRIKQDQARTAIEFQTSMSTRERPLSNNTVRYREGLRVHLKQLKIKSYSIIDDDGVAPEETIESSEPEPVGPVSDGDREMDN